MQKQICIYSASERKREVLCTIHDNLVPVTTDLKHVYILCIPHVTTQLFIPSSIINTEAPKRRHASTDSVFVSPSASRPNTRHGLRRTRVCDDPAFRTGTFSPAPIVGCSPGFFLRKRNVDASLSTTLSRCTKSTLMICNLDMRMRRQ